MARPSAGIAFIARTHWTTAGVVAAFSFGLYALLHDSPILDVKARTLGTLGGVAALYALVGTLVWFGAPLARPLNAICSFLYFVRPPLGARVWDIMRTEEYRAHFRSPPRRSA